MTCAQMGGMCDQVITGSTPEEMMSNGMKHLEEAHPEMATSVKTMPQDDPQMLAWVKKFNEDFEDAPLI